MTQIINVFWLMDNSYNPAKQIIEGDDRYIIIKNTQKKFALKNIID